MSESRFEVDASVIEPGVCRGCKARVYWARTINGRPMILDSADTLVDLEGRRWVASSATHWSTCPQRAQFVKPKKAVLS
jgi:hypothetical protein